MRYILWGTGKLAERAVCNIGIDQVEAFVDSDKSKVGGFLYDRPVLSIDQFLELYLDYFIVICFESYKEGIQYLREKGISQYLVLRDCPGEYLQQEPSQELRDYVYSILENKAYCIHGLSLYTLQIYQWIKERGGIARIYSKTSFSTSVREILKKNDIEIEDDESVVYDYQLYGLHLSTDERNALKENELSLFDCMDRIKHYHNKGLKRFKDIHKNKRCFVVCTGPSLKIEDLDTLYANKEICLSMNSIFEAFSRTKWRPDYYFLEDKGGFERYSDKLDGIQSKEVFLADVSKSFWQCKHDQRINRYHLNFQHPTDGGGEFSEDIEIGVYGGGTVAYTCFQFAVYMGIRDIYLLGMDFTMFSNDGATYGHFYEESTPVQTGDEEWTVSSFIYAKQLLKRRGVNIYNATRGGRLEIFERVDFDMLF